MKNYLKNSLVGLIIGLALIPITFIELYYIGGEALYITEIVNFDNFAKLSISMPCIGILVGLFATIIVNTMTKQREKEMVVKNGILLGFKILVYSIFLFLILFILSETLMSTFSENIMITVIFNTTISIVVLIIAYITLNSITVCKINKKLKENTKNTE